MNSVLCPVRKRKKIRTLGSADIVTLADPVSAIKSFDPGYSGT